MGMSREKAVAVVLKGMTYAVEAVVKSAKGDAYGATTSLDCLFSLQSALSELAEDKEAERSGKL